MKSSNLAITAYYATFFGKLDTYLLSTKSVWCTKVYGYGITTNSNLVEPKIRSSILRTSASRMTYLPCFKSFLQKKQIVKHLLYLFCFLQLSVLIQNKTGLAGAMVAHLCLHLLFHPHLSKIRGTMLVVTRKENESLLLFRQSRSVYKERE